jgi:ribonucleoside-diphosphate reductase alpha chain
MYLNLGGAPVSTRTRLPNRRLAETFTFECSELRYTCTIGRFPDGSIGELFLTNHKSNSAADTNARDAAITFSIAVQHGADPDVIRRALCRDENGHASGPLGTALDLIPCSNSWPRLLRRATHRSSRRRNPLFVSVTKRPRCRKGLGSTFARACKAADRKHAEEQQSINNRGEFQRDQRCGIPTSVQQTAEWLFFQAKDPKRFETWLLEHSEHDRHAIVAHIERMKAKR